MKFHSTYMSNRNLNVNLTQQGFCSIEILEAETNSILKPAKVQPLTDFNWSFCDILITISHGIPQ